MEVPVTVPTLTPTPTPTPSNAVAFTRLTPADACLDTRYPTPLTVRAESFPELESLDLIDACTDAAATMTYLHNRSELVWRLYADDGAVDVDHSTRTTGQEIMQALVQGAAVMEPDSAVVVHTAPRNASWYADPSLTATFAAVDELEGEVIDTAVDKSPDLLREKSRAKAHLTCAAGAWGVARNAEKVGSSKSEADRTEAIAEGVKSAISGAGECRTALDEADDVQLREGKITRPVLARLDEIPAPVRLARIERPVQKTWALVLKGVIKVV